MYRLNEIFTVRVTLRSNADEEKEKSCASHVPGNYLADHYIMSLSHHRFSI